jgi:ATP-dependent protease ClpP protease subunit
MIKVTNSGQEHTIELFGDIGQSFWSDGWTFERFKAELKGVSAPVVNVKIKSNGGDVFEAFAIYDELRAMAARVVVDIVGSSASAATIIAAAGDEVRISENSRYLVHNAQSFVAGNKEALAEVYEMLQSIDNQIINTYVKRTGKDRNVLAELMKQERWMTAQEALDWGFVDSIIKPVKITNKMDKFANLTEEEQAEMDALKAENEQLKAKLAEMEAAEAAKMEEEITEEVEAAVKAGKITAEARASFIAFGKADRAAMTSAINGIKVTALADIVQPEAAKTGSKKLTADEAWAEFKAGKINAKQYHELIN